MHPIAPIYFTVTGLLTAVTLCFPPAVIVALFFFIVPGLVLLASPPLFMYGLVAFAAWTLVRPIGRAAAIVTAAAAMAACAILPPLVLNEPLDKRVSEVTADDRALGTPIATMRRLALLRPRVAGGRDIERETDCGDLCQRLLFNGAVDAVLLGTAPDVVAKPNAAHTVTRYRVERRDSCPAAKVPEASSWFNEHPGGVSFPGAVSDRVKARIAEGECLVAEEATLRDADAVVIDGKAYESAKRAWDRPWDLRLISLRATRVSAFAPSAGDFTEIYRHTSVEYEPLLTPFMVNAIFGHGFNIQAGFVRWKRIRGAYDLPTTFRDVFRFDVSLPRDVSPETMRNSFAGALADPSLPPDHPRLAVAERYLKSLDDSKPAGADDVAVVRAMIGDKRIRSFIRLAGAVIRLGPEAASLAGPLLDRIMASQMVADRDVIHSMSTALRFLPQGALVPVMDRLKVLAADEQRRGASWRALSRLADGGAENLPLLIELTRPILDPTTDGFDRYDRRDTPIGALIGLCLLGEQAQPAVPFLLDILKSPRGAGLTGIGHLARVALVRIGAAEAIEDNIAPSAEHRRRIEWEIARAREQTAVQACNSVYS